jgi:hypothetical protein
MLERIQKATSYYYMEPVFDNRIEDSFFGLVLTEGALLYNFIKASVQTLVGSLR